MNVPIFAVIAASVVLVIFACSLAAAWTVIRRLEREMAEERKERRELGYKVQDQKWEADRCFALLGLERTPKRDAEWVKREQA